MFFRQDIHIGRKNIYGFAQLFTKDGQLLIVFAYVAYTSVHWMIFLSLTFNSMGLKGLTM
ncbi:MAG TPA: hypothetical protein DD409_07520 [Bacteroidales bacterium]|nr:hypothetical protein [Bacteroidales bacterium]